MLVKHLFENDLIAPEVYALAIGKAIGLTAQDLNKEHVFVGADIRVNSDPDSGSALLVVSFKAERTSYGRNVKVAEMLRKNCNAIGVETKPLPWFYQKGGWSSSFDEKFYRLNFYFDRLEEPLPKEKLDAGLRSTAGKLYDKVAFLERNV